MQNNPELAFYRNAEGKTLLHLFVDLIRKEMLNEFIVIDRNDYFDGFFLDPRYINFLKKLIEINPDALHIKDNDGNFASDYAIQLSAPAKHSILFTSLFSFLLIEGASCEKYRLEELMKIVNNVNSLALAEKMLYQKVQTPLMVYSCFKSQEVDSRHDLQSAKPLGVYLRYKIELDIIFLQVLPQYKKMQLPVDVVFAIIFELTHTSIQELKKLNGLVIENYEKKLNRRS